jgi:hypothetical protein
LAGWRSFTWLNQERDDGPDRDSCADRDKDLAKHAAFGRLDLNRGFVGLDLEERLTGHHPLSFLFAPTYQGAFVHRQAHAGHHDLADH